MPMRSRTQKTIQMDDSTFGERANLQIIETFVGRSLEDVAQVSVPYLLGQFDPKDWSTIRVSLANFIETHPYPLTESDVEQARTLLKPILNLLGEVEKPAKPFRVAPGEGTRSHKAATAEPPKESCWEIPSEELEPQLEGWDMSSQQLYRKSVEAYKKGRASAGANRKEWVKIYVRRRANGRCEYCNQKAAFQTAKGHWYLEPHHTIRLADNGLDHPDFVIALCPTCHRNVHYGCKGGELNELIKKCLQTIVQNDPNHEQKSLPLE